MCIRCCQNVRLKTLLAGACSNGPWYHMIENCYFFILRLFRLHQIIFMAGIGSLLIIDFFFLEKWGTFWVMLGWSMLFGIHYLFFRSQEVDDEWLKEKMIFNVYRLWDYGHIGEIKKNPFGRSIYRTEDGRIDKENEDDPPDSRSS